MAFAMRIWADENGESHFADLELSFTESDFVPPAPPVLLTEPVLAESYLIERVPPEWYGHWHNPPQRVLALYLAGEGEMEASDGEVRPLVPGTILLAEDTTGRGHITRMTGKGEMLVVIVNLPDS